VLSAYSLDTSCLINAWNKLYQPDLFPSIWTHIDGLWRSGALVLTDQVRFEIESKDDALAEWCKERKNLFRPIDEQIQVSLKGLMARHRRIAAVGTGRNFADPFVVALAQTRDPFLTVVTEEERGKETNPKIPYICAQERMRCINFNTLLRETSWKERR
jgi:hypothetical protein